MVGLYKDPKGETISTFGTSGPREEAVDTSGSSKDKELQILRRRISQLETCLKQQVGTSTRYICIKNGHLSELT